MRLRVAVFGVLGILTTALGLGLVLFPALIETGPLQPIEQWATQRTVSELLFAIGLGVLLYLLFAARSGGDKQNDSPPDQQFARAQSTPPEVVTADKRQLAAASLDERFTAAIEAGDGQFHHARELLYQTAVVVYADARNSTPEVAREHIDSGDWTGNRTAATVLARDEDLKPSLLARLHLWLRPERERKRRLNSTVDAIVELQRQVSRG